MGSSLSLPNRSPYAVYFGWVCGGGLRRWQWVFHFASASTPIHPARTFRHNGASSALAAGSMEPQQLETGKGGVGYFEHCGDIEYHKPQSTNVIP